MSAMCGVDHPMDPGFAGGVRVVQWGDRLGACGDGGQEGAGDPVLSVAGVSTGMLLLLKASEEIEICFTMISSSIWVSCSG